MISLYPKNDKDQKIRIKRFLMAASSYLVFALLILYCYYLGIYRMPFALTISWFVFVVLMNVVFYSIFRLGINLRFKDKSLTMFQIAAATLVTMVTLYFLDQVRGAGLLFYIVSFSFGIFRLQVRQFLILAIFALLGYLIIILLLMKFEPDRIHFKIEVIRLIVLAVVLLWFSFLGGYLSRLRQKVEHLATNDPLTGVYNRRQLFRLLEREKSLASRGHSPFALCILDIDQFKNVNDTFGHQAGDTVLSSIATIVNKNLRKIDHLARYGGEEFTMILSYPDIIDAIKCAERIKNIISSHTFHHNGKVISVTVSIGVTIFKPDENIEATLSRADKALYQAKENGRNLVEYLVPD
ncbi:MAG: GGDEF domain-containing protein [Proteobacteria bacterium]|nr:GGDEF domain-containing protein [Pseudomonadota bacterium]